MSRYGYEQCPKCAVQGRDSRADNLVMFPDGGAHCFSCGYHRFPPHYSRYSVDSRIDNVTKSLLPPDFTREIPTHAWKWLLQYGLPLSYWKKSTGYSPSTERLIFLVGDPLHFSIGRWTMDSRDEIRFERGCLVQHQPTTEPDQKDGSVYGGGGSPVGRVSRNLPRKWHVWGDSHKHTEIINGPDTQRVVCTEDLISAHKVGQVTTAIPLFGVNFYPCHIWALQQMQKPVILWLDKDQEHTVKHKATQLSSLIDMPVDIRITELDPKELNFKQINEVLNK